MSCRQYVQIHGADVNEAALDARTSRPLYMRFRVPSIVIPRGGIEALLPVSVSGSAPHYGRRTPFPPFVPRTTRLAVLPIPIPGPSPARLARPRGGGGDLRGAAEGALRAVPEADYLGDEDVFPGEALHTPRDAHAQEPLEEGKKKEEEERKGKKRERFHETHAPVPVPPPPSLSPLMSSLQAEKGRRTLGVGEEKGEAGEKG